VSADAAPDDPMAAADGMLANTASGRVSRLEVPTSDGPNAVVLLDGSPLRWWRDAHQSVTGRGRFDGSPVDVTVASDGDGSVSVSIEWAERDLTATLAEQSRDAPGRVFTLDCVAGLSATVELVPADELDGETA